MGAGEGIVWYLRTSEEDLGSVRLVVVEGRVSSATASELSRVLTGRADGPRKLVVDLTGVDYINGAGLRAFETAAAALDGSGGALVVCGLQPPVQVAFDLAGAIPNLTIAPSRDAALLRLRGQSDL
jgi:stage II sporulation protein AA (anti-sigma F factor antagonist)